MHTVKNNNQGATLYKRYKNKIQIRALYWFRNL